eukprot:CAMPEP_0176324396 /NCGR_PEP_ID=MMETSP0121_2-20121125/72870_1 /TAXON_ID=160619 /ORGANISM="Kryptoperidinium foliaceum, Strain CCMP 1326" /LENGTH=58 /DNA_ID=CAMNT_0017666923 /DNA_START=84 /DNA_END=257 /DNA_ORIENTATION=+
MARLVRLGLTAMPAATSALQTPGLLGTWGLGEAGSAADLRAGQLRAHVLKTAILHRVG